MKEDYSSAAPTTAPNTSLGIKAGPVQIGKKQKGGPQGSQRAPAETQIIMAGDNNTNKVVETLSPSASAGDWIHDFVHSKNSEFKGKSKKERIKMALGAYYHREEMTPHLWNKFKEHSINRIKQAHQSGSLSTRDAHLQLRHQGLGHQEATKKLREAEEHDSTDVHPKDFIHAGFGAKGGTGFHGHVDKVEGNKIHFTSSHTEIGLNGKPYKRTFVAPRKFVTVLHHEDYIVDMKDLNPILEAHRMPLEGHPYHKKSDAELHHIMKDAGEASRLHDQMHKGTGKYNKYADQVNDAATVLHYRRNAKVQHKEYDDSNHHRADPDPDNNHHWKAGHVKEDVIYEAGSKANMKRKYLGKTRGTTATGKTAHEVVIDPILKADANRNNGRPSLPAPDRGI